MVNGTLAMSINIVMAVLYQATPTSMMSYRMQERYVYLSIHPSVHLSVHLSICPELHGYMLNQEVGTDNFLGYPYPGKDDPRIPLYNPEWIEWNTEFYLLRCILSYLNSQSVNGIGWYDAASSYVDSKKHVARALCFVS